MAAPMRALVLTIGLLLLAGGSNGDGTGDSAEGSTPTRAPELVVTAPPELADAAERVDRLDRRQLVRLTRFVGLDDPGAPIHVALEPRGSAVETATPAWVAGFAYGALGRVVVFPERSPPYPYGSFEEVVLHELTHVLAARAAGYQELPRWFNEGLAVVASGTWGLDDRSWLTLAAVIDSETPLAELEDMFAAGRARSGRAYAMSGAFVRDLVTRKGTDTVAQVLAVRRRGLSFDEAFRRSVGADPETAARAFWRRYSIWYRWVPIATSSLTLWIGITGLAVWAAMRKRRRRALMEELWEAEDALAERDTNVTGPPPGGWVH